MTSVLHYSHVVLVFLFTNTQLSSVYKTIRSTLAYYSSRAKIVLLQGLVGSKEKDFLYNPGVFPINFVCWALFLLLKNRIKIVDMSEQWAGQSHIFHFPKKEL